MRPPAIKICGITTADTLDAAIAARADFVGFVFVPASPRVLELRTAAALAARGEGRIKRIGLFVDASDTEIAAAIAAASLDGLQLHGNEPPSRTAALRERHGLPVWKALSVASASDIAMAEQYTAAADLILFDAKTPKGTLPGGLGLAFDWELLRDWRNRAAWGLAGGLNPGNIGQAIRQTGAPLVDTSSGVEDAPGRKNADLIHAFCSAARGA